MLQDEVETEADEVETEADSHSVVMKLVKGPDGTAAQSSLCPHSL